MWQRISFDTPAVLLGAALLLLIAGQCADLRRVHVGAWNDQVGYISVARNLVETGELKSNIVYTSTLAQKTRRNVLYMPGHYLVLALCFLVAGIGPVQAVLPSMASYCIATVSVFLTCRRLYGRKAGLIAAALFALFPAVVMFSFTAMAEMTLLAAVSVAFCAFVHLSESQRLRAGSVLLVMPFLFRETAALLVIPMAGMLLGGIPFLQRIVPDRWRAAGIFCLISAGLLAGLYRLPPSGGRPSLMKAIVFDSGDLDFYHDATVWDRVPPGAGALLRAIGVNTVNNISRLNDVFRSEPRGLEPAGLFAIVAAVIVSLGIGLWRRDVLIFGCGMLGFAVLVLVVTIYRTPNFGGLRHLLFTWPLLAVALGASLAGLLGRGTSVLRGLMSLILLAGLVGGSMFLACRGVRSIAAYDAADDQAVALLESTEHDRQRLIASPYWMGLPYAASNHPVKWAFLPANVQTLSLLMDKYDVGTLIVPHNVTSLESGRILEAGFTLDREIDWPPYRLRVFKAPPKPERRSSATLPSSRRE